MKKIVLLCFILCFCRIAWAEEMVIKLKDGVVVRGEVVSMNDGVYTVRSSSLGMLSVRNEDVVSIQKPAERQEQPSNAKEIERRILNDPGLMDSVKNLANDQSVIEALSDPQLKAAIMRQDVEYLKNNEKFIKLMNNKAIQGIVKSVAPAGGDSEHRS